MPRAVATTVFLAAALALPYWAWAPLGVALACWFPWYLEAPALAAILEGASTADASGRAAFPIAAALLAVVGVVAWVRPRLAASRRDTL